MAKNFDLPIPNGWYVIAYADELAPGGVQPVRYFNKDLVLFRTDSGVPSLLDAYCPHLGAHLGYGGKVDGEVLRCPFHAWEFGADGQCKKVPYADHTPRRARQECNPVLERNGFIYAWHHAGGAAPDWEPGEREELNGGDWSRFDKNRWVIATQAQELVENIIDSVHFRYVHGTTTLPQSDVQFTEHRIVSDNSAKLDTPRGPIDGRLYIEQEGLGLTFTRYTAAWDVAFVTSTTPVDEDKTMTWITYSVNEAKGMHVDKGLAKSVIAEVNGQLEQDIPIWENKIYRSRPMLSANDGPILKYRKWAQQFYS